MSFFDFLKNIFPASPKKKAPGNQKKSRTSGDQTTFDAEQIAADMRIIQEDTQKRKRNKNVKKAKPDLKKTQKKKKQPAKAKASKLTSALKLKKSDKPQKAKKVKSAPIDKENLGFGISFSEEEGTSRRKAFRITVSGLKIRCEPLGGLLLATDLSASGIGFKFKKPRIKCGVRIKLDIVHQNNIVASDIPCKVVRHEKGTVGCQFLDMDRHQEDAIHSLVVVGQKEQAARRKQQKDAKWTPPS